MKNVAAGLSLVVESARVEEFMIRRVKDRMMRSVDPDGQQWVALSPHTVENKRAAGARYPKRPLLGSLTLRDSITRVRDTAIRTNTGFGFRIGVNPDSPAYEYAVTHQRGGRVGRNPVPQRRFLGVSPLDVRAVMGLLRRETDKLIQGS